MKLLVLGGTRFLGRHLVDAALARGHDVTIFTRGVTPLPPGARGDATRRQPRPARRARPGGARRGRMGCGDRHQRLRSPLRQGGGRSARRTRRPLHVRFVAVGVRGREPPGHRRDRARRHARGSVVRRHQGALRRAEGALRRGDPRGVRATARSSCARGSSSDPSIRPTASRTGLRGSCDPDCSAQEARPRSCRDRATGRSSSSTRATWPRGSWTAWRPAGPGRSMPAARRACGRWARSSTPSSARGRGAGSAPVPAWVDDATLVGCGIVPWTGLPLWIPATDPESAAFMDFACARAIAQGLAIRPLAQTIDDTAAWLGERDNADAWRNVLSAEKEREALAGIGPERVRIVACRNGRAIIGSGPRANAGRHPHGQRHERRLPRIRRAHGEGRRRRHPPALPRRARRRGQGGRQGLRSRHRRRSRGRDGDQRGDRARVPRSRHSRRGARLAEGRVEIHVGDRPHRRHAELHPGPDALGHADRAARRRRRGRRSRAPAVRRRDVHGGGGRQRPSGGAGASGARSGRGAARPSGMRPWPAPTPGCSGRPTSAPRSTALPTGRG